MPKAIFWVVILSTSLYVLIALVTTLSMPLTELAHSAAPLADLLESKNPLAAKAVATISVFAIVNGVLIQIIMASRVCYGMSKRYGGPAALHRISPTTHTPVVATLLVSGVILTAALFFPLILLAKFTSFIILVIFTFINIALWKMQRQNYRQANPETIAQIAGLSSYPMLAALLCLGLLIYQMTTF